MFSSLYKKLANNDIASAALILLAMAWVIQTTQIFSRLDNLVFDVGQKLITSPAPEDIVIVAIDEYSLSKLGRWPWSRQIHADLINRLSTEKPAAIGLDIIFSEPDQNNPTADLNLANAIKQAGNVVLPVMLESSRANGQVIETLPLPTLVKHAADIGRVHAVFDEDSVVRSVFLHEGLGAPVWQLFAQAVINAAEKLTSQNHFETTDIQPSLFTIKREEQRRINFLGPAGHFPSISYVQVMKGEYPKGLFTKKIILIGATALGLNDSLTTPVSGLGLPMSGVEFHANVVENIREIRLIQLMPFTFSLLIVSLLALSPLLWLPKLSPFTGFLSTLFAAVLIALLSGILPKFCAIWIPPSAAFIPLLLAYPIWSWRKLESAQKFFDIELDELKQNLLTLASENPVKNGLPFDKFDARISQVKAASAQLRLLQKTRKETLEFISHDIRAPIAVALSLLKRPSPSIETIHQQLTDALELADEFLNTSRAEMAEVTSFGELDYTSLIHQAIDDTYEIASQKNMPLRREITENIVWINGSFGLLHRAILNLILNALKYGDTNTAVLVKLTVNANNTAAIFSVTNHGAGIAISKQSQLFKRFSRISDHESMASGSGLGLYFVKTVVDKHQGTIEVISDANKPTTFTVSLPIVGVLSAED